MIFSFKSQHILIFGLLVGLWGCQDDDPTNKAFRPLQPLIYTELPNLTPEAAEIRERRLVRELVDGQRIVEEKVKIPKNQFKVAKNNEILGELIFKALITQNEALWDHVFVSPESYARIVHIKKKDARKFVDELLGKSKPVWSLFTIKHASEAPAEGLGSVYEFAGLVLGQGRLANGRRARKGEHADQYWGNKLKLKLKGTEVLFELYIPKILSVVDRRKNPSGQPVLCIASKLKPDSKLKLFVASGMHLKPELLRSQEYPYPLSVGNFWRYRRYIKGQAIQPINPMDAAFNAPIATEGTATLFDATESMLEVLSMERYRGLRLVKMRKSYNDQRLTNREFYWVMTPRQIYPCSKQCVRKIKSMSWLLGYMQRTEPLFEFPLVPGQKWGKGIERFVVDETLKTLQTTAGIFISTFQIIGQRGQRDPLLLVTRQTQFISPGRGVVRLVREGRTPAAKRVEVVEDLVELRVMP